MKSTGWSGRLARRRLRPGDGTPLPPFRWWQTFSRSVRTIELAESAGRPSTHTVDVRQLGDGVDGAVRARLYVDGRLHGLSRLPARFPVPGGHIEVAAGVYGLTRCHLVPIDGRAVPLVPHPSSAEGLRARLHRRHPRTSRALGALSTLLVVLGVALALPALLVTLTHIPPVAQILGTLDLPVRIPAGMGLAAALAAAVGSVERALRLRTTWLDHLAS